MANLRFADVTISAVQIKDAGGVFCRAEFIDTEALKGDISVSHIVALDLTVHTQWGARLKSGVHFGVRVAQMPVAKLNAVVAALEADIQAGRESTVQGFDSSGVDSINVKCRPVADEQTGRLYSRGANFSSGLVRDVTFRFLSTGANT